MARREAWGKQRDGGGFLGEKRMGGGEGEAHGGEGEREGERDGVYVREILNGYGNGNDKGSH